MNYMIGKMAKNILFLRLCSGVSQYRNFPKSREKAIFVIPMGKFEFKEVPFSLAKDPSNFQQLITKGLHGLDLTFGYINYILTYSLTVTAHLEHLLLVYERQQQARSKSK